MIKDSETATKKIRNRCWFNKADKIDGLHVVNLQGIFSHEMNELWLKFNQFTFVALQKSRYNFSKVATHLAAELEMS